MNRAKSSRSDRISSDLKEINIFVGLTLIIFFVAIGFPTLINTSPSLGYEGINFTPVTTMYQEAYAEMELRETIFWYSYNPLLFDTYTYKWLVSLAPPEFPPDDPFTRYLENEIKLGVGIVKQLLTEPLIPSAYADHIQAFDTTNKTTWNIIERDVNVGGVPDVVALSNATDNAFIIRQQGGVASWEFFKSFESTEIDGAEIRFLWKGQATGSDFAIIIAGFDGEFDRTNSTEFPIEQSIPLKGAGELFDCDDQTPSPDPTFALSEYTCTIDSSLSTTGDTSIRIRYDMINGVTDIEFHEIEIDTIGIWNFTKGHTIDYTDTGSVEDNGEVSADFQGRTHPDPYMYHDFDVASINADGKTYANLGTAGSIADAFSYKFIDNAIPETAINITISLNNQNLFAGGLLGEGAFMNATGTNLGNTETAIQFGTKANKGQWKFIEENNDGTGLFKGSNLTSINYWYTGDPTGTDSATLMLSTENPFSTPNFNIFTANGAVRPLLQLRNDEGDVLKWNLVAGDGQSSLPVENPDDGIWHMVTVLLNKTGSGEGTLCVDTVCFTDAFDNAYDSTIDPTINQPLMLSMPTRHTSSVPSLVDAMEFYVDEFAIWDDHLLNSTELEYLFNNGDGRRVLTTVGSATAGLLNFTLSDTVQATDPSPPLPPFADPLSPITPFTRNQSDVWQVREHHTNSSIKTGINFTETPAGVLGVLQDLGTSDVGTAWIFKVFNDTDVQGKEMIIEVDGNATDPFAGQHFWEFVHIYDCELKAFSFDDFGDGLLLPSCTDSPPLSGNGSLNDPPAIIPFDIPKSMHSDIIDLDAITPHTSPLVTLLIRNVDNNITSGHVSQIHSIIIGNETVGQRIWNFSSPEIYWESFPNGTDKACETDDLICNNNFGLVRTNITDIGRTYPDPYLYMDFDVSSINTDGKTWQNLGTAGTIADGFNARGLDNSIPPVFENFTIQLHVNNPDPQIGNLESGGILGEAVLVAGSDGTVATADTWVQFGTESNKEQWRFLTENNDDGSTFGSNRTSMNFWYAGDMTGDDTWTPIIGSNCGSASNGGMNLWTSTGLNGLRVTMDNQDGTGDLKYGNAEGFSLPNGGFPTVPPTWHMVSLTLLKTSTAGTTPFPEPTDQLILYVDGVLRTTYTQTDTWDATVDSSTLPNPLILGLASRHADPFTSSCESMNGENPFDEVAVWDNHILTQQQVDFLYNNGSANRVLAEFGDASHGFNILNLTSVTFDTVVALELDVVTDGANSIQEEEPDVWQIREHKTNSTTSVDVDFEISGSNALGINNNASAGDTGTAWLFKVFDDTELENFEFIEPLGKPLVVDVEGTAGGTGTFNSIVHVYDCDLTAFGQSDFEDDLSLASCTESPAISGDGKLNNAPINTTLPFARQDLSDQINIDEITPHTSNRTTVLIGIIDESISNTFEAVIHSIRIGNNETGSRTWNFTNPILNWTSTAGQSDSGLVRASSVTDDGRSFTKPYIYVNFDDSTVLADGSSFKNLGKAGEIANGFMAIGTDNLTPPSFDNITASVAEGTLSSAGLFGQAIIVNGTDSSTATGDTWVQFGTQANQAQYQFLNENNNDGVTLGSNKTAVNFWYFGDITNGGDTWTWILGTNCGNSGVSNMNIWRTFNNNILRVNVVNDDGSGTFKYNTVGSTLPTTAQWHMISVNLVKTDTITSQLEVFIDGVSTGLKPQLDTWDSTIDTATANPLILGGTPRHSDPFSSSCEGLNGDELFDELSVWDDTILTQQQVDFLYNAGAGNTVLVNATLISDEEVMVDTATTSDQVTLSVRDARSYPDPYLYINFDNESVKSNGTVNSLFTNLGTAGIIADGIMAKGTDSLIPPNFDNVTISQLAGTQDPSGIIGEAVILNGTTDGAVDNLWVQFGIDTNDEQWLFLQENNDDAVTLGSNLTSVNFWHKGNLGGLFTWSWIAGTGCGGDLTGGYNIYTGGGGSTIIRHAISNNEANDFKHAVTDGTFANDANWHMTTFILNKTDATNNNGLKIYVDGVLNSQFNATNAWDSAIDPIGKNPFIIGGTERHSDPFSSSCSAFAGDSSFDELAVWDNYNLNATEIRFLWSGGNGSVVLLNATDVNQTDTVNVSDAVLTIFTGITNVTITDTVTASDQTVTNLPFVPIDNLEVYWKFDHITPTYESEFIDTTEWSQIGTEIQIDNSTTSGHLAVRSRENQDQEHGLAHQFSANVSNTNWVVRFSLQNLDCNTPVFSTMPTWFGIANTDENVMEFDFLPPLTDSLGFAIGCTTAFGNPISLQTTFSNDARAFSNNDNFLLLPQSIGEQDWYLEIIRNSATSATWNFYNDAGYTDLRNSTTRTISSAIDDMEFLKFTGDRPNAPNIGTFDWNVDKVKFWNATSDIHAELHTEDFANIDDADSGGIDNIVNKTEVGKLGRAWQTDPTNTPTIVNITGTTSDWNFLIDGDVSFNMWITQADPVAPNEKGTMWQTFESSGASAGDQIVFDYGEFVTWVGRNTTALHWQEFSPSNYISTACRPDCTAFSMYTFTKNNTSGEIIWYLNGTQFSLDTFTPVTGVSETVAFLPSLFNPRDGIQSWNDGITDEFSVWSRTLNPTEISDLYNAGDGLMLNNFEAQQQLPPKNVTITDTVSASDQTATNLPFVPIDNLEVYWKFDHITPTYQSEFIDTSEWQQTGTHMNIDNSTTSGQLEIRLINDQTGIHAISHQLSGNASDTEFVLRFPIQKVNGSDAVDNVTIFAVYGISSTDHTTSIREFISPLADSIGLRIDYQANTEIMLVQTVWSDDERAISNNVAIVSDAGFRDIYVEIIRNSATSVTWNLYNDTGYTELWKTTTRTINAGVDQMDFIRFGNDEIGSGGCIIECGFLDQDIDNVKFWNATTDIHTEFHAEDFAIINDADSDVETGIFSKNETGATAQTNPLGNAWESPPTGDDARVTTKGTPSDYTFFIEGNSTINMWIKDESCAGTNNDHILHTVDSSQQDGILLKVNCNPRSTAGLEITYVNSIFSEPSEIHRAFQTFGSFEATNGTWNMYTMVHTNLPAPNAFVAFYKDGVFTNNNMQAPVGNLLLETPTIDRTPTFWNHPNNFFTPNNMTIDEVSFWNTQLNASEIADLYNDGFGLMLNNFAQQQAPAGQLFNATITDTVTTQDSIIINKIVQAILPTNGSDTNLELYYKFNTTAPMINEPISRIATYLKNNGTTTSQTLVTEGTGLFGETNGAHTYGETNGNERSTLVQSEQFDFLNVTGADSGLTLNVWARGTGDCGAGDVCTFLDTSRGGSFADGIYFGISNVGFAGMRFAVDGVFQNIGAGFLSTDNTYHMYTFRMNDTGEMEAYKDAVFQGSATVTAGNRNFLPIVDQITIGSENTGSGNLNFEQFMDEMSLWSTALSQEQLELLYNNGTGINITGTAPDTFLIEESDTVTVTDTALLIEGDVSLPVIGDDLRLEWYFKGEQVAPIVNENTTLVGFRESESENSVTLGTGIIDSSINFNDAGDNSFFNTTIANNQRFMDSLNDTVGEGQTFNFWLKSPDRNRAQYFIVTYQHAVSLNQGCWVRGASNNNDFFQISCDQTALGDAGDVINFGILFDNAYHMYTVAIDPINGFTQFYRDSLLIANFTGGTWNNSTITHGDLTIGANQDVAQNLSAGGDLDEISIWSTELDTDQIKFLYRGGIGAEIIVPSVNTTDLEVYWKFEETSGILTTEEFVNIPDADSINDSGITKTNTGVFGNAWRTADSGSTFVNITGTLSDWDFIQSGSHSYNLWMQVPDPDNGSTFGVLFATHTGGASNGGQIDVITDGSNRIRYFIGKVAVGDILSTTQASNYWDSTCKPNCTSFQMVTLTANGTSGDLKFYRNGTLFQTNNVFNPESLTTTKLPLLFKNDQGSFFTNKASFDEWSIWSRVLTPTEITTLFNNGDGLELQGVAPPLVLFNATAQDTATALDQVNAQLVDIPPDPITTLNATQINSVFLNWTAPNGTITGYKIQRNEGNSSVFDGGATDFIRGAHLARSSELAGVFDRGAIAQRITTPEAINVTGIQVQARCPSSCLDDNNIFAGIWNDTGSVWLANSTNFYTPNQITSLQNVLAWNFDPPVELFSGQDVTIGIWGENASGSDIRVQKWSVGNKILGSLYTSLSTLPPSFIAVSDDEMGIDIAIEGWKTIVADTGTTVTNFTDSTCPEGMTCFYNAIALNGLLESEDSNLVNATEGFVNGSALFDSTGSVWQYREYDDAGALSPKAGFDTVSGGALLIEMNIGDACCFGSDPRSPNSNGMVFKVFPLANITDSSITVNMKGESADSPNGFQGVRIQVLDGGYLHNDYFQIAQRSFNFTGGNTIDEGFLEKGEGILGTLLTEDTFTVQDITLSSSNIAWANATQDEVTIALKFEDTSDVVAQTWTINNVTISEIGIWDFENGTAVFPVVGSAGGAGAIEENTDSGFYNNTLGFTTLEIVNQIDTVQVLDQVQTNLTLGGVGNVTQSDVVPVFDQVNVLKITPPDNVTGFTITNDNVNREIDLSWDTSLNADSYRIERLSTEREIVTHDATATDDNFLGSLTQSDDHGGDNIGVTIGEIITRMNSAMVRNGADGVGGALDTGVWFNLIDSSSTQEAMNLTAEYSHGSEWTASNIPAGSRPERSCRADVAEFRQDGMTPLASGVYFDGGCRDQAIFRGNQLHNLTSTDLTNTIVAGRSWINDGNPNDLPNGDGRISVSIRSGSDRWDWNGSVWTTPSNFHQLKIWSLNQTAVSLVTLVGNGNTTFTDDTVLEEHGYFYRIIPINSGFDGNATIYLNQTLSLPPDHVPDLNGTDNTVSVDLDWSPAEIKFSRTESGDPIQGYIIQRASGENETRIHEGYGRDAVSLRDHPDRAGSGQLTGGFEEAYGQQLNLTSAQNVTRFVALLSHTGAGSNAQPTIQGAIWDVNGTTLALSMNPKIDWNGDRIVSSVGRYVNVIFDPPIQLPIGEYVFGFIHSGWTCGGSCGGNPLSSSFANQELTPRYNNTNNGDADGFAVYANSANGNFPATKINGTNADLAISIYAEADWTTIGSVNANTFTFTDNSPPTNVTKAYRVLPFNDFGIADVPVLAHDPFQESINATGDSEAVQGFSHSNSAQNPPFVDGTFGKRNIGEIVTFEAVVAGQDFNRTASDIASVVDKQELNITKILIDTSIISDQEVTTLNPVPNAINDLSAFVVGNTCELTWSAPINLGDPLAPINGYKILRAIGGASFFTLVANTSSTLTAFNDTGLVAQADHNYDIRALNKHGEASGSNIDSCLPQLTDPPNSPTILIAINVGENVQLDWIASTEGNPTGYFIERKIDGGAFATLVSDTGNPATLFVDTTVDPATKYFYRVSAINAFGTSAPSNEASVTTLNPPSMPTLFAVQNVNQIDLSWTEPTNTGLNGYQIDRRINFGLFSVLIANTSSTDLNFTDNNVTAGNVFGYRVRGLDIIGAGTVSNVVDVNFGSHVIVQVREQDGTSYKGGGSVIMANSTFSTTEIINGLSNADFDNFEVGNYNFTFIDLDDFILNRTINFPFPSGNLTSTFEIRALVFDVDCPSNGGGTDVRIKVNYTDLHDITQFPSAPVCDSSDKISWSTTWAGSEFNSTSTMIADFISVNFLNNAEEFLVSTVPTGTSYDSIANRITSDMYGIVPQIPQTSQTINFDLFLGQSPPSGGGGGGSPAPFIPSITPRVEDLELTGLSLLSRTHQFAQAGDIIRGFIDIQWEGEDPLTITRITIGDFTGQLVFLDSPRFDIPQSIEGSGEFAMSSGSIPYVITLPPQDCQPEIGLDQNCLIRELFPIPVEFEFEFKGQTVTGSTNIMVDASPVPFDIVQLQVILLGILLIASALAGNFIRQRLKKQRKPASKKRRKFKKKFDSS